MTVALSRSDCAREHAVRARSPPHVVTRGAHAHSLPAAFRTYTCRRARASLAARAPHATALLTCFGRDLCSQGSRICCRTSTLTFTRTLTVSLARPTHLDFSTRSSCAVLSLLAVPHPCSSRVQLQTRRTSSECGCAGAVGDAPAPRLLYAGDAPLTLTRRAPNSITNPPWPEP